MKELHFAVHGMHCSGCVAKVQATACGVPGVNESVADLAERRLVVYAAESVDPAEIVLRLEKLGFSARYLPVIGQRKIRTWYTLWLGEKTVDVYAEEEE